MGRQQSWILVLAGLMLTGCALGEAQVLAPTITGSLNPTVTKPDAATRSSRLPTQSPTTTPTVRPTFTPLPTVVRTPFPGCPSIGNPPAPRQPANLECYPEALLEYLNDGASLEALEQLLREWAWLDNDWVLDRYQSDGHMAWNVDLTGDEVPEVVAVTHKATMYSGKWGDLVIFQCREGRLNLLFSAVAAMALPTQGASPWFKLVRIDDLNTNGRSDIAFEYVSCGVHTCMERLFIVEWDGTTFVNLAPGFPEMPYPSFKISQGQLTATAGWYGSAGAGYPRDYGQIWTWNGTVFTVTEELLGPPTTRVHYLYDGDDALLRSDPAAALQNYQKAISLTELPAGTFSQDDLVLPAFAQFKMIVAYSLLGDEASIEATLRRLQIDAPAGSGRHIYSLMGEAFWEAYQAGEATNTACEAATAVAASSYNAASQLYAGYAQFANYSSTHYASPEDLCKVP